MKIQMTNKNNYSALYKMKDIYSTQHWYSNDIFQLVEITKNKIRQFGTDCEWKSIISGKHINIWDETMVKLNIQEERTVKIRVLKID